MSERRARKKAQTREHVRAVARQLFAEHGFDTVTIADIARRADVAVQTVFNHFPTKEELFFDGRTPWVAGPADAVRHRRAADSALTALKDYLGGYVRERLGAWEDADLQGYVRTVEASPTLRAYERELVFESERRLTDALFEAWSGPVPAHGGAAPRDPATAAALTAAMWLNAIRALVVRNRERVPGDGDAAQGVRDLGRLAERLLDGLTDTTSRLGDAAGPEAVVEAEPLVQRPAC